MMIRGQAMSRPQPSVQDEAHAPYPAYDDDLVGWAAANAALLRAGRLSQVDRLHLAEELEDLGKSERRSLTSHLGHLMLHLLKWKFQPGLHGPSWRLSVNNARAAAAEILEDSPSLRPALPALIDKVYPDLSSVSPCLRERKFLGTGLLTRNRSWPCVSSSPA